MKDKEYPFWMVASHTFILGAGASRAAFPKGDKFGRTLPLMCDFVDILGLVKFFKSNGIDVRNQNIEDVYDQLYNNDPNSPVLEELNNIIVDYFSALRIPDEITLYDELILGLQKKDAIFSFNWDPLLVQAYSRNLDIKELPHIYFLHGNVAIGICEKDNRAGYYSHRCSICNVPFKQTKLLYPVKSKNYASDPFIMGEWKALEWYIDNSFILSIFGYSAPTTDTEARNIMLKAWGKNRRHELNEINIIDIKTRQDVKKNWSDFIYKTHGGIYDNIRDTQPFKYARRSCESFGEAIMQCAPWHENNIPKYKKLNDLHNWLMPLIEEELNFRENGVPVKKY